ncbi:MAG: hypothetical protein II559_05210 [Muribaculaceae bacterium]|nr:hypothetical protein [Muribaculaceae bacterium]
MFQFSEWVEFTLITIKSNIGDLYAGGDIVRGGATVILAMGDGRRAAQNMAKQLLGE